MWSDVWKRFKRDRIALYGFYVVGFLLATALFADFIANDKPYYLSYKGTSYFPILRGYLVGSTLGQWPAELQNVDFKKLDGASALFPPTPQPRRSCICRPASSTLAPAILSRR